jgi:UDPglucose 6-dehydrogenase
MTEQIRLAVVGTGYVGLTTGACFAHLGHHVVCGDIDQRKVDLLNGGHIPIVEEGLGAIVAESRAAGRLDFVLGAAAAAAGADIVFLCVPTPQGDDGSADLSYIEQAAGQIAPVLKPGAVVVNKSTVPVGSTNVVERVLRRNDVSVVSNPEFLREGTAVRDFLHPDRVVIGSADRAAVVEGIGSDQRIGMQFLRPGPGWGGSCFPKDSRALVKIAEDHGYNFTMMRGVIDVNDEQLDRMVTKIAAAVDRTADSLDGVTVGALGLTFKAGTDDLRESPALAIIGRLRAAGAEVRAYDPTTTGPLTPHQEHVLAGIELVDGPTAVAAGADVITVFTEWPEFAKLELDRLAAVASPGVTIVDTRNLLDPAEVRAAGFGYDGVGRR